MRRAASCSKWPSWRKTCRTEFHRPEGWTRKSAGGVIRRRFVVVEAERLLLAEDHVAQLGEEALGRFGGGSRSHSRSCGDRRRLGRRSWSRRGDRSSGGGLGRGCCCRLGDGFGRGLGRCGFCSGGLGCSLRSRFGGGLGCSGLGGRGGFLGRGFRCSRLGGGFGGLHSGSGFCGGGLGCSLGGGCLGRGGGLSSRLGGGFRRSGLRGARLCRRFRLGSGGGCCFRFRLGRR